MDVTWNPSWLTRLMNSRCTWRRKFTWLPHRSLASNRFIWCKPAWQGLEMLTGPGDTLVLTYWLTPEEYVWYQMHKNL